MNFCFHCGNRLTVLHSPNGWTGWYRCDGKGCEQRYEITYGDATGGVPDTYRFCGNRKFPTENVVNYHAGNGITDIDFDREFPNAAYDGDFKFE